MQTRFFTQTSNLFLALLLVTSLIACDSGTGEKTARTSPRQNPIAIANKLPLAAIDNLEITGTELKAYLALFKIDQPPATIADWEKIITHLVDRTLLLEAARRAGYDKIDELRKHGSLGASERETIILRKFLTDRISRPATPDQAAISNYLAKHPDLDQKQARERLAAARQRELFGKLMAELKKGRKIIIYHDNLKKLPVS